jgi:uncharacterized protein with NRDE domain
MCLVLFAHEAHPEYRLIVAANRDEYYDRPAAPAGWWEDAPDLLAGRDLVAGGTWLGVTREGRFAALTNYRGASPVPGGPSRGTLAVGFLRGELGAEHYARTVAAQAGRYQGFSLLVGDRTGLWVVSTHHDAQPVSAGVHGLSNHLLDTPWPKVRRGTEALADSIPLTSAEREARLLATLADRSAPADRDIPTMGASLEFERALSAPFIHSRERRYGTRCTTLLSIRRDGGLRLREVTWDDSPRPVAEVTHETDRDQASLRAPVRLP